MHDERCRDLTLFVCVLDEDVGGAVCMTNVEVTALCLCVF